MDLISNFVGKSGQPIANQTLVSRGDFDAFYSYGTLIAFHGPNTKPRVNSDYWDYSATTLKYLKAFMCPLSSKADIAKDIASGRYVALDNDAMESAWNATKA